MVVQLVELTLNNETRGEGGGGGDSVSRNFGKISTFHSLTEQHLFISFSQPIYKRINILFIYLT
jgi:hypothetical protein